MQFIFIEAPENTTKISKVMLVEEMNPNHTNSSSPLSSEFVNLLIACLQIEQGIISKLHSINLNYY